MTQRSEQNLFFEVSFLEINICYALYVYFFFFKENRENPFLDLESSSFAADWIEFKIK